MKMALQLREFFTLTGSEEFDNDSIIGQTVLLRPCGDIPQEEAIKGTGLYLTDQFRVRAARTKAANRDLLIADERGAQAWVSASFLNVIQLTGS